MSRVFTLLVALTLAIAPLRSLAIVYDLRPESGTKAVREALRAKKVLTEAIVVNGQKGVMEVSMSDLKWTDALNELRPLVKAWKQSGAARTLLFESEPANGMVTRHLVVSADERSKTLIFTMETPVAKPNSDNAEFWPTQLPRPLGARIEQVTHMTDRGAIYLTFEAFDSADQIVNSYASRLESSGWRTLTNDHQSGAAFVSGDETHMIFLAANEGEASTRASLYVRRIR